MRRSGGPLAATLVVALAATLAHGADEHANCAFWADAGECERNPAYMLVSCADACASVASKSIASSFYELSAARADGSTLDFATLRGGVTVIANVASE